MFRSEKIIINAVTVHLLFYEDYVVEDYFGFLLPDEIQNVSEFKNPVRQQEYLATRYLRTQLFGKTPVHYSAVGSPYLSDGKHISISHAKQVVGIACCDNFPIGFDLEPIHEKVHRVKHKFLHSSEVANFDTNNTSELIKIWSAKEALYKVSGRNGVSFSNDLILEKINEIHWKGTILEDVQEKSVTLSLSVMENFVLSVTIEALKTMH